MKYQVLKNSWPSTNKCKLYELFVILMSNIYFKIKHNFQFHIQDCDKKTADYIKSAASGQRELETLKKQLGITGDNVRSELMLRTHHLSEVYENVITNMKALQKPIQYYSAFSRHVAGVSYTLPLLSYAIGRKIFLQLRSTNDEKPIFKSLFLFNFFLPSFKLS